MAGAAVHATLSEGELQACRAQYDALVSAMRDISIQHDLRNANPLGALNRSRSPSWVSYIRRVPSNPQND